MASFQMILLTTCRRPTNPIRAFCNDMAGSIPGVFYVNRGKLSLDGVAEKALEYNAQKVVIVDRWHGGPGKIEFFQAGPCGLSLVAPVIYVAGVRFRREFGEGKSKSTRSLAITVSTEKSGKAWSLVEALSNFFNVPVLSLNEAVFKYDVAMNVWLDAKSRVQLAFVRLPQNVEIGPRITVSHMVWKVGK